MSLPSSAVEQLNKVNKPAIPSASNDELLEEFCCCVCFQLMQLPPRERVPKLLSCSHTICATCFDTLTQNDTLSCPTCRQNVPVGSCKNNVTMIRLMSALNIESIAKNIPCGNCDTAKALFYCFDCPLAYCEPCCAAHRCLKTTKGHTVQSLSELEDVPLPKVADTGAMCHVHADQQLDMYCEKCDKFICRNCTVLDHPSSTHTVMFLAQAAQKYVTELNTSLSELRGKIESAKAASALHCKNVEKLEAIQQGLFNNVDTAYAELAPQLVAALEYNKGEVKSSIASNFETVLKEQIDQIQRNDAVVAAAEEHLAKAQAEIGQSTTTSLIKARATIKQGNAQAGSRCRVPTIVNAPTLQLLLHKELATATLRQMGTALDMQAVTARMRSAYANHGTIHEKFQLFGRVVGDTSVKPLFKVTFATMNHITRSTVQNCHYCNNSNNTRQDSSSTYFLAMTLEPNQISLGPTPDMNFESTKSRHGLHSNNRSPRIGYRGFPFP